MTTRGETWKGAGTSKQQGGDGGRGVEASQKLHSPSAIADTNVCFFLFLFPVFLGGRGVEASRTLHSSSAVAIADT